MVVVMVALVMVVMVCEKQFVELANAFGDITDPPAAQLWESFQKANRLKPFSQATNLSTYTFYTMFCSVCISLYFQYFCCV